MQKIKAFLSSTPKWKLLLASGGALILIAAVIFLSPILRRQATIKLGSASGITITANKQDSLGVFSDSQFTLKSDQDLSTQAVKDNLKTDPEIKVKITEVSPRQYQIAPVEPLKSGEIIRLRLSTGDRDYSWAFQTKNTFRVVRTLPTDRTSSVPVNSGIEITFSHDNYDNVDNYFTITPKVNGRFERHGRITSFVPSKLDPGTLYTVTVKKGLKLNGTTDILSDSYTFQFETASSVAHDQNRFNFVRPAYEFSSRETPAIDLYANNIDSLSTVNVTVYKYPSVNKFTEDYQNKLSVPRWATAYYDRYSTPTTGLIKTLEFSAPIQKANYSGYFLFPQTMSKGYYLVEAVNGDKKSQALVQVTDLSAYFTVSGSQTMAWVNRVDTGSPSQSATVSIFGKDYSTDKDGVAIFVSPASLVSDANQLITIKDSHDTLLIPAADRNSYYPYGDYQTQRRVSDKYWSYLYLDRPIYQPTDTVRFWGLLRDRDDLNKTQPITISLSRSDYLDYNYNPVTIYEKDYQTSNLGTFIGDIPLPKLNPGFYTIDIKINDKVIISSGFSVETYTKPAYQLTLESAKNAIIAGDPIDLSGKASFFEGTPVGNLDLKIIGQTENQVTTDNQGSYKFTIPTSSNPAGEYSVPVYRYFSVNPVQAEESDINAGTSVAVFNSSIYLRTKTESSQNTSTVSINLNQIDLNKFEPYQYGYDVSFVGDPVANHQIQGELIENSWEQKQVGTYYDFINKVTSPKYVYSQVSKSLGQFTINTDTQGQASYQFSTTKDKYYQLKLSSLDSQNRLATNTVYLYGSNLYSSDDTNFFLSEDKTIKTSTYLINEPVSLTPMIGSKPISSGKILYIFAQRGITGFNVEDPNKFTFNFKEAFIPNVYIQAVRFTGTTYQQSESKLIQFDNTAKRISLGIQLDKLTYLPGDKAHLTVTAKDSKGSPLASEVNINLVDEAIFQMSPVSTDPLPLIYKTLGSDIVSFYLSHQYPIESNMAEGGGCFLPGTKIILANGKTQDIEKIKVGDLISTRTSESNLLEVSAKVNQVLVHQVGQYLLINHQLRVTPEHNLYINGRWLTAGSAKLGDSYLNQNNRYQIISSIETHNGKFTVYNLSVDKYHTYFADGFYVHNEKGRDLFLDTAFFGNVQTGANGQAGLDITLPDNLTSWRITAQSITSDLKAGVKTEKLVVKQPFFVDLVLGKDYLVQDKPILTLRGFGDQLNQSDTVNFHVSIPTLSFEKDLSAKAYDSVGVSLPTLLVGTHQVIVTGSVGSLKDKITRSFDVLLSRLQIAKSDFQNLTADTKVVGSPADTTTLVFSDQSSGRYLSILNNLSYSSGDRLDQKLSRVISSKLINQYFDTTKSVETFDSSVYRMDDGGYALLPYSSSDPKLSVEVACLAGNEIDKTGLVNYFFNTLTKSTELLTTSQSLAGLSCLNEPVLLLVNKLITVPDLDPESKIYLSLAQASLGDTERSIATVKSLIKDYGQNQDNILSINIGKTKDDILENTSLIAAIAAINDIPESDQLYNYISQNYAKNTLLSDNLLIYINQKLAHHPLTSAVSFAYTLDGKKISKELKQGETFKLILSPKQLSTLGFSDIKGNLGVTSTFDVVDIPTNLSKDLSLNRAYFVSGKSTTEFVSSDLIKVTLNYSLSSTSQDGCYQVNDYLPSGLRIITHVYDRLLGTNSENISYPYSINGQKVSFCVTKTNQKPINYYARVISPGSFAAESALMQSMISPSIFTLSNQSSVNIK